MTILNNLESDCLFIPIDSGFDDIECFDNLTRYLHSLKDFRFWLLKGTLPKLYGL